MSDDPKTSSNSRNTAIKNNQDNKPDTIVLVDETNIENAANKKGGKGGSPRLDDKKHRRGVAVAETGSQTTVSDIDDNPDRKTRLVMINYKQRETFLTNYVRTSKYTCWSFLPIFIYEQFRRYSNIFFLCIALLQQIPDVSPTGKWTTALPFSVILTVSAIKEMIEDFKRHNSDEKTNAQPVQVLRDKHFHVVRWRDVKVGDFVKIENECFIPADIVLYGTSEPLGICYIETANLDGETNLKIRQALPQTADKVNLEDFINAKGFIECGIPNREIYEFAGRLQLESEENGLPLGPDQLLLRGAKLRNTCWIYGQVVYSGHDTKLMKNSSKAPLKQSTLEKSTNKQIIMLFIVLILISLIGAACSVFSSDNDAVEQYAASDGNTKGKNASVFFYQFLTFIILFNNLIPISLTVTLEVVRFIQALFINWDDEMYNSETNIRAVARTSNLNEELGQIRYIFSDKTGTLTRNIMEFKGCSVDGVLYPFEVLFPNEADDLGIPDDFNTNPLIKAIKQGNTVVNDFLTLLAICHYVIPEMKASETGEDVIIYNAASPDERALVLGAKRMGFIFLSRTPTSVEISVLGEKRKFEILNLIEFTSTRKRMSVVCRCPDGKIRLYCKGADSVILDMTLQKPTSNVNSPEFQKLAAVNSHLHTFSTNGLRTLCCAMKILSEEEHRSWNTIYQNAANTVIGRETAVNAAAEIIEKNMNLLGSTAIEDKLQENVPETIEAFMEAGISVWILTGDKQETAINIGNSCRLLNPDMKLLIINHHHEDATLEGILEYARELKIPMDYLTSKEGAKSFRTKKFFENRQNAAVIIDGRTLTFALTERVKKEFIALCCSVMAVIVCRAAPLQKAEIVEHVTKLTRAVTLAIGDGANDVAMIQKAHVGVGISGLEGLQAASSSDYALAQFSHLKKLLFVHGAYNHDRITKTIYYSFYKNICLYIIELWFAIYSSWSGQIIFDKWQVSMYNMLFTCLQPIAIGVFEQNCSKILRMKYPSLYHGTSEDAFTLMNFFIWLINSLIHSILLFWLSKELVGECVLWKDGKEGSYLVLGNFIFSYVVIAVSLKAGLESNAWSKYTHLAIWGSLALWVVFFAIYSNCYRWTPIGSDIFGLAEQVSLSPLFWIGVFTIPTATLLPDLIYKAVIGSFMPSECDIIREYSQEVVDWEKINKRKYSMEFTRDIVTRNRRRKKPKKVSFGGQTEKFYEISTSSDMSMSVIDAPTPTDPNPTNKTNENGKSILSKSTARNNMTN